MLSVITAPPNAPQNYTPIPAPPVPPRLDRLDRRLLEVVRDEGVVQVWFLLNNIGDEEAPGDRAKAREIRLALWARLKRLLRLRLVWRHRRRAVGISEPPVRPALPRQVRRLSSWRKRKRIATVRPLRHADAGSTAACENSDERSPQAQQVAFQLVSQDFRAAAPTEVVPQSKSAPSREQVTAAARQLATLPRKRKKWSGWLNDHNRIWRDRKILVEGCPAWCYGVLRRRVIFFLDRPRLLEPGRWGVVPASRVRVWTNPAARLLGRLKRGTREQRSEAKIAAARRNGLRPCAPGKRRGRPAPASESSNLQAA